MIHIVPINDEKGHELSLSCSCAPLLRPIDGGSYDVVSHNSFDLREVMEEVNDILGYQQKRLQWEVIVVN
jgi:hypothetical protein